MHEYSNSYFATSGGSLNFDPSTPWEPDIVAAIIRLPNIGAVRPRYANAICDLQLRPNSMSAISQNIVMQITLKFRFFPCRASVINAARKGEPKLRC